MMMNSRTLTTTHCHGTLRLTTSALFPPLHQTHQKKSALKHQPPINTLKGKKKLFDQNQARKNALTIQRFNDLTTQTGHYTARTAATYTVLLTPSMLNMLNVRKPRAPAHTPVALVMLAMITARKPPCTGSFFRNQSSTCDH